jgi:hypothetical protein
MMARPARVRMRSRKPWVLARRRLFGWKVRFTSGLLKIVEASAYIDTCSVDSSGDRLTPHWPGKHTLSTLKTALAGPINGTRRRHVRSNPQRPRLEITRKHISISSRSNVVS